MGRRSVVLLVLLLAGCTPDQPRDVGPSPLEVRVARAVLELPESWSYAVSRQPGDSWSFDLSARHGFNLGHRCAPDTGSLGGLLKHEKVFVFGSAYPGELPPAAARSAQTPGDFRLDATTFGPYEGSGCRSTYRLDFEHEGYHFMVHVALHRSAGSAVEDELLDVLNSVASEG